MNEKFVYEVPADKVCLFKSFIQAISRGNGVNLDDSPGHESIKLDYPQYKAFQAYEAAVSYVNDIDMDFLMVKRAILRKHFGKATKDELLRPIYHTKETATERSRSWYIKCHWEDNTKYLVEYVRCKSVDDIDYNYLDTYQPTFDVYCAEAENEYVPIPVLRFKCFEVAETDWTVGFQGVMITPYLASDDEINPYPELGEHPIVLDQYSRLDLIVDHGSELYCSRRKIEDLVDALASICS